MDCSVCYDKYDTLKRRPQTLYPCSHTICLNCLINLPTNICPTCRSKINDNKPNFALIDLIPDLNSKKLDLNDKIKNIEQLKAKLNTSYDNKLKEINDKFKTIRYDVQLRADQLINEANSLETDLVKGLKKISFNDQFQLDKTIRQASEHSINHDDTDFNELKNSFEILKINLNEKVIKINKFECNDFEFLIGSINWNKQEMKQSPGQFATTSNDAKNKEPKIKWNDKTLDDLNPNSKLAIRNFNKRADHLRESQKYAKAIGFYNKIIELDSSHTDALLNKGLCLHKIEKYTEAIQIYDKALETSKENKLNVKYIILINKAATLKCLNKLKEAINCYDSAIEINPENPVTYNDKGNLLFIMKDLTSALECYEQAIRKHNRYTDSLVNKGICLTHLKEYDQAIQCYERVMDIDSNNLLAYINKGLTLHSAKNYIEAIKIFNKYIDLSPHSAEVYNCKGVAWFELKNYLKAIECYDKSIIIDPNCALSFYNKGCALNQIKSYQDAVLSFDEAILLKVNYAEAYSAKGYALKQLNRFSEAMSCFELANQLKR